MKKTYKRPVAVVYLIDNKTVILAGSEKPKASSVGVAYGGDAGSGMSGDSKGTGYDDDTE